MMARSAGDGTGCGIPGAVAGTGPSGAVRGVPQTTAASCRAAGEQWAVCIGISVRPGK